eukprot:1482500-Rhodomonas_salina.2
MFWSGEVERWRGRTGGFNCVADDILKAAQERRQEGREKEKEACRVAGGAAAWVMGEGLRVESSGFEV